MPDIRIYNDTMLIISPNGCVLDYRADAADVEHIIIKNSRLVTINWLPTGLVTFRARGCSIKTLPNFGPKLEKLVLHGVNITELPPIPTVKCLSLSGTKLTKLPEIPNVEKVNISGDFTTLPEMPKATNIYVSCNAIIPAIPMAKVIVIGRPMTFSTPFPAGLEELNIDLNPADKVPKIDHTTIKNLLIHGDIEELPPFPPTLEEVSIQTHYNVSIPPVPSGLKGMNLHRNIKVLPLLAHTKLKRLTAWGCQSLPPLPDTVEYLMCTRAAFDSLTHIPAALSSFRAIDEVITLTRTDFVKSRVQKQ